MGKSVSLSIRLPEGIYNEIKKMVDEDKLARSYAGYCCQVISQDVMKRIERND